jgi:chemotaxis signal transduction protein
MNRPDGDTDRRERRSENRIIGGRLHGTIDLDGQPTAVVDLRRPSDDPEILAENKRRIAVCDSTGNVTGVILGADIDRFRATNNNPDLPSAVESALATGLAGGVSQVGERLLVALNHDQEKTPALPTLDVEAEPQ